MPVVSKSSGSDSDSGDIRFNKKTGKSQRQRSLSTSASSSDSEPEQGSARPSAEKLAPPPLPKKKPSAQRNPKPPCTSNLKRVEAEKGAKADHAAEEQPGLNGNSVFKGKRPVVEEAEPSNPKKKKLRKQQQESAVKEARDGLNEFLKGLKKLLENSEARTRALLSSHSGSANGTWGGAGAAGTVVNSVVVLTNRDPDLEGVYSNRGFPVVEEGKVQLMKAKWRAFHIRELEVKQQRYELLQEENFLQMEALQKPSGNGTSH